MPKQTAQSDFMKQMADKGRKAFEAHKTDETNFGFGGDLPPGIDFGIARLVECKFAKYKKGEFKDKYFFYAAGVVVEPKEIEYKGQIVRVEGLRTNIMEPMCDTPKKTRQDVDSHFQWVLNEFRKLGIKTEELSFDDLETTAAALEEIAPHFKFRTWAGDKATEGPYAGKEPLTNHQWQGATEYASAEGGDVVDSSPDASAEGSGGDNGASDATTASDDGDDIESLVTAAESEDAAVNEPARVKLASLAEKAGATGEQIQEAASWTEVADLIRNGSGDGASESGSGEFVPEKTNILVYPILDPKSKKKVDTEVEVIAVQMDAKTVHVKNLTTGRTIIGADKKPLPIKWDAFKKE